MYEAELLDPWPDRPMFKRRLDDRPAVLDPSEMRERRVTTPEAALAAVDPDSIEDRERVALAFEQAVSIIEQRRE